MMTDWTLGYYPLPCRSGRISPVSPPVARSTQSLDTPPPQHLFIPVHCAQWEHPESPIHFHAFRIGVCLLVAPLNRPLSADCGKVSCFSFRYYVLLNRKFELVNYLEVRRQMHSDHLRNSPLSVLVAMFSVTYMAPVQTPSDF